MENTLKVGDKVKRMTDNMLETYEYLEFESIVDPDGITHFEIKWSELYSNGWDYKVNVIGDRWVYGDDLIKI